MPHRTFLAFVLPSMVAMLLFIALPVASVLVQSFYVQHDKVLVEVETCGPFDCTKEMRVDPDATRQLRREQPLGKFNGLGTYLDHNHLAGSEVGDMVRQAPDRTTALNEVLSLPFYRALTFTLAYTFIVTPLAMALGFVIALAVVGLPAGLKGAVIYFSLLPMIVTPLIGSLIFYWMINSQGIIGATLQAIFGDPTLSLKSSALLTWITLFIYGIWTNAPFSFVVFYAGLQTVPADRIESAMIDGASAWERVRYITIPHLAPLATFVALVQLMDNFRVLEPIVGLNAQANATSLSFNIYTDLHGQVEQLFGSAAATSMVTILGIALLLTPVLFKAWREFKLK